MKATLKFYLPAERTEHLQAVMAGRAWSALHDLDVEMRSFLKHNDPAFATAEDLAAYVRAKVGEALERLEQ